MSSKWITSLFKSVVLTAALVTPFAASAFTEAQIIWFWRNRFLMRIKR